jgi:hypothetical protein
VSYSAAPGAIPVQPGGTPALTLANLHVPLQDRMDEVSARTQTRGGSWMSVPQFNLLAANYPDYWKYPGAPEVKKHIGGGANDADISNTCTIRMSHAMNLSGAPVPHVWGHSEGKPIANRRGKNGQFYIIRVANFRTWMAYRFGAPTLDFRKQPGVSFERSRIAGFEGVIAFDIGFKDATGHFDLWYGDHFSHERMAGKDYFALSQRITLWSNGVRTIEASA